MTPVSHGKPCAGNPHARFDEGASASEEPRRNALLHKDAIRKTAAFKALRNQTREALAAYADRADFDFTIARLAGVGYKMGLLLG